MNPFEKDVLTTGEVAKICNVASRTVSKWFDSGQLRGYRIPGSKDRRIPVSSLIKFMKSHGIPMDGLMSGNTRVLIVDDDEEIVATLQTILTEQTNYEVRSATSDKLTDGQAAQLTHQGFDSTLRKPFSVRQVIDAIEGASAVVY